jgi:DNA-binding CsgD family transcriptional regulator
MRSTSEIRPSQPSNELGSPLGLAADPLIDSQPTCRSTTRCTASDMGSNVTAAARLAIGGIPDPIPEHFAAGRGSCPVRSRDLENCLWMGIHTGGLRERVAELAAIDACLQAAQSGRGSLLIVDGSAGIGKTSLIEAARRRASAAGFRVLAARGGQLEQEFAFGLVRQLFEPLLASASEADRGVWLAGAAALAAPLVDPSLSPVGPALEATYRLFHALYWLLANLADEGPLTLIVDDAHWADTPSVRFLGFLATRIDELPVAVVLASRPERPELEAMQLHDRTHVLRPAPLSPAAVAGSLADALGRLPAEEFVRACRHATGGNPFLVRELVREIASEGIVPDAAGADEVGSLSPRAVATSVLLRLTALPPAATALARSIAVLEQAALDDAAIVAGLDRDTAGEAADALVGAGVLASDSILTFVHPIVRTAIYRDLPAVERGLAHQRAARVLADRGAGADRVAAHLLLVGVGASWAVGLLRDAGAQAAALGAPATAAAYLERALLELGPGADRVDLLIELGDTEQAAGLPAAIGHLREAVGLADDRGRLSAATIALSRGLRYGGHALEAVELLQAAARRPGAEGDSHEAIDLEILACAGISIASRLRLADWLADRLRDPGRAPQSAWDHLVLVTLALDAALSGHPAAQVEDLAARALAGLELLSDSRIRGQVTSMAGLSYLLVDRFDRAEWLFEELIQTTSRLVLAGTHSGMLANRASLHLRRGRLTEAKADAERALELGSEVQGARAFLPRAAAVLVSVAAEQGGTPPAWLLTADIDADSQHTRLLVHSRAELLLAQGQLDAAVATLLAYGERNRQLGWEGPATPWRSQAALALERLKQPGRARELADEELALARRQGTARSIGVALRAVGLLEQGALREQHLSDAVEALAASGAMLDHAWALVSLGIERRHRGAIKSARDLLRHGHDAALRCDATRLARLARAELRMAGARPRRSALSGPESLTPGERRVVDLVAGGMTNREVAQALFLTEKTVETHLGHAYTKLGINSRRHLTEAVGGGQ